jgi:formylglycine-generating enzyme required for sulfatase activity
MKITRLGLAVVAAVAVLAAECHAVTIETVPVGNPGNAPDLRYNLDERPEGYGAVPYRYRIGKYEVTAGQYTEFLNAVAAEDIYGLYNESMDVDVSEYGCNIKRMGDPGSYTYSVAPDWSDRPVNLVSFWDAARFANWLHNGQPTGPQGPGTTEGGAYHDVGDQSLFGRNPGTRYFIPTEDEWYKAAYHDKTAGLAASYFDYPTGTDAVPGRDLTEATNPGNNANYWDGGDVIGPPYYRTEGGEFELSDSPYGTFDQGGNVWEWNETALYECCRGLRGGAFVTFLSDDLHAAGRINYYVPSVEGSFIGFRIATIPEPGSLTLVICGAVAGLIWWRSEWRSRSCGAVSLW